MISSESGTVLELYSYVCWSAVLLAVPIERSDGLQHLITKVSSVLICINVKEPPSRYLLTTPPPLKRKTLEKSRFGKSLCWDASSLGNLWLAGSSSNLLSQLFDRVCIKKHFENSWWKQFSYKMLNSILLYNGVLKPFQKFVVFGTGVFTFSHLDQMSAEYYSISIHIL